MSKKILYAYLALVLFYVWLNLSIPTDANVLQKYDLTEPEAKLLGLTVVVPVIAIWFAAFYGYSKFKKYADTIRHAKDGQAFKYIANGLGVLALSLPVSSILSRGFSYLTHKSPDLLPTTTIISNYIALLFSLAAFVLIYIGSQKLVALIKESKKRTRTHSLVLVCLAALSLLYAYLTLHNPNRQFASGDVSKAAFYLPDALILLTIIIPYVLSWFIGMTALGNLKFYESHTSGVLYKKILRFLARGIAAVVLFSITLQFLVALTPSLLGLSLKPLLGVLYLLLIAMAVGYLYIAVGAKRLQKIEEV